MTEEKAGGPLDGKGMLGSDTLGFGTLGAGTESIWDDAELGVEFEPGTVFLRDYGCFYPQY
jgi:hypothetical protein